MEALRTLIEALPCHNSLLLHNCDYVKFILFKSPPQVSEGPIDSFGK